MKKGKLRDLALYYPVVFVGLYLGIIISICGLKASGVILGGVFLLVCTLYGFNKLIDFIEREDD